MQKEAEMTVGHGTRGTGKVAFLKMESGSSAREAERINETRARGAGSHLLARDLENSLRQPHSMEPHDGKGKSVYGEGDLETIKV